MHNVGDFYFRFGSRVRIMQGKKFQRHWMSHVHPLSLSLSLTMFWIHFSCFNFQHGIFFFSPVFFSPFLSPLLHRVSSPPMPWQQNTFQQTQHLKTPWEASIGCWKRINRSLELQKKGIPTLPKTNSSHLKIGHPKRKLIFQPSIFRCELLVLGRVFLWLQFPDFLPPHPLGGSIPKHNYSNRSVTSIGSVLAKAG